MQSLFHCERPVIYFAIKVATLLLSITACLAQSSRDVLSDITTQIEAMSTNYFKLRHKDEDTTKCIASLNSKVLELNRIYVYSHTVKFNKILSDSLYLRKHIINTSNSSFRYNGSHIVSTILRNTALYENTECNSKDIYCDIIAISSIVSGVLAKYFITNGNNDAQVTLETIKARIKAQLLAIDANGDLLMHYIAAASNISNSRKLYSKSIIDIFSRYHCDCLIIADPLSPRVINILEAIRTKSSAVLPARRVLDIDVAGEYVSKDRKLIVINPTIDETKMANNFESYGGVIITYSRDDGYHMKLLTVLK